MLRTILNNKQFFWLILALPGIGMATALMRGQADAMALLHPSGEFSARFMIIAMMLSPLVSLLGPKRWLRWLVERRRCFGVAAAGYALLHLILYVIDMGNIADMIAEFTATGIWTGWAAMLLFIPLGLSSNDAAVRALKAGWKRLQRLVYPAAVLVLLHWIFVHNNVGPALVHFIPLALLVAARALRSPSPAKQGV